MVDDAGDPAEFQVFNEPESAGIREAYEGTNVCRVAALSCLLENPQAVLGQEEALRALGFGVEVIGHDIWGSELPIEAWNSAANLAGDPTKAAERRRLASWLKLQEGDISMAPAFLIAVLGSPLERESMAAAVAILRQMRHQDVDWPRYFDFRGFWEARRALWPPGTGMDALFWPLSDPDWGEPPSPEASVWNGLRWSSAVSQAPQSSYNTEVATLLPLASLRVRSGLSLDPPLILLGGSAR